MSDTYLAASIIVRDDTTINTTQWASKSGGKMIVAHIDRLSIIFADKESLDRFIEHLGVLSDSLIQSIE